MAEAIRKVRGNLEFANVDGDLKSLVVTSPLQHEGKSLMVCNLALSIAATGKRVLLVDGDLRRPRVHLYLDLPNVEGVATALTGRRDVQGAIQLIAVGPRLAQPTNRVGTEGVTGGHLHVLTSGPAPPDPAELVASRSFANMMADLRGSFDLVIVDSPAVLAVGDTAAIARSVDGLILLVALSRARRPVLQEAARQVNQMPTRKLGLVVLSNSTAPGYAHRYEHHAEAGSGLDSEAGGKGRGVPRVVVRS
jgi:capsular exopolysaccharide synthesis family protein